MTMTPDEIKAHAEALTNATIDFPSETDFVLAEDEIRRRLADGMVYTEDLGWHQPTTATAARVSLRAAASDTCRECGQPVKVMCMKGTGACSQQHQGDPSSS